MSSGLPITALIVLAHLTTASAAAINNSSTRLTRYLLSRHEAASPPEGIVAVGYESQLVHIIAVEERKQTITLLMHVTETWRDSTLSWSREEFGGISSTWLPSQSVWIPDIIVFNMLDRVDVLNSVRSTVSVFNDGRVSFSYPQIVTLMCPIHIADFPFDSQSCTLEIASWGYEVAKLEIHPVDDPKALLRHYQMNEEWALKNISVDVSRYTHEDNIVSEVRLKLSLQRKPLYFITSLLLPTYIICALSIAGLFSRFSTREERQERFTLGVTATLTLAVLSLVVTEKVPHTSDEIPALVLYFHFNTLLITFATFLTSLSMTVSQWDKLNPRIRWLKKGRHNWPKLADRLDSAFCIIFFTIVTIPFIYMCVKCMQLSSEPSPWS